MRVRDLMSRTPITALSDTSVLDARALMAKERIRHLPVTDSDGELLGIVTDRDIRLTLPSPATTLSVWEMNHLLAKLAVGALPVLKDGRLVGILTETDLLRAFAAGE
jgi:acetoin utilization protein AcuB